MEKQEVKIPEDLIQAAKEYGTVSEGTSGNDFAMGALWERNRAANTPVPDTGVEEKAVAHADKRWDCVGDLHKRAAWFKEWTTSYESYKAGYTQALKDISHKYYNEADMLCAWEEGNSTFRPGLTFEEWLKDYKKQQS